MIAARIVRNDVLKLVRLIRRGVLPRTGVVRVEVRHDDGCPELVAAGGGCTCDPEVWHDGVRIDREDL